MKTLAYEKSLILHNIKNKIIITLKNKIEICIFLHKSFLYF